jgi:hypothetical protein
MQPPTMALIANAVPRLVFITTLLVNSTVSRRVCQDAPYLTKAQSLLRLRKALVYLAGHQLIEHSVPARTQSRGKFSQMRGFIVRAKTKSRDQVCRSCYDLISAGTKKWQSHREPLDLRNRSPDRLKPVGPVLLPLSKRTGGAREVAPTLFSLDADKLRSGHSAQQLLSHQIHICRRLRLSHIRDSDGVLKRAAETNVGTTARWP